MNKQKTNKTASKRFRKNALGKLFRKYAKTSHLNRKEQSNRRNRKRHIIETHTSIVRKIAKLI